MIKQLLLSGVFALCFSALFAQSAGTLFSIDAARRLTTLNPANGEAEVVSALAAYDGELLAYNQSSSLEEELFFLAYADASQSPRLLTLSLSTGAMLSDMPLSTRPRFLKYHCLDERLYALDEDNALLSIDPLSAQAELVGTLGFSVVDAATAALDPYGNRLYLISSDNRLLVLDTETAAIVDAQQLPQGMELSSLEYNCEDGFLYGLLGDGARLIRLNAETGILASLSANDLAPNGYLTGDRSLNLENGTYTFPGRDAENTLRLFTLSLADGDILFQPALSEEQPYLALSYANRCIAEAAFAVEGGCTGAAVPVQNASKARTYLWDFGDPASPSNNSTAASPVHVYSAPGTYLITLIASTCDSRDTASQQITISPRPENPFDEFFELCPNDTLVLDATVEGADAYLWQDTSAAPTLTVEDAGLYSVSITIGACTQAFTANVIDSDCPCFTELPNAFTPNGDGINDFFGLLFSSRCDIGDFRLRIFNRWGEEVFASTDYELGWDGNAKDKPLPADIYFYQVQYTVRDAATEMTRSFSRSGDVALIR